VTCACEIKEVVKAVYTQDVANQLVRQFAMINAEPDQVEALREHMTFEERYVLPYLPGPIAFQVVQTHNAFRRLLARNIVPSTAALASHQRYEQANFTANNVKLARDAALKKRKSA